MAGTGEVASVVNWAGAARGAALNYLAVSAAWEVGLYVGSAISEKINDIRYGEPKTSNCDCNKGK